MILSRILRVSLVNGACSKTSRAFVHTDIKFSDKTNTQNDSHRRTKLRSIYELMRWNKPTGTILALTPALWSLSVASSTVSMLPQLQTVSIFTVGAVVARGMGCTVNDLLDRKYDRLVERTKNRPIANGDISVKEGIFYLAIQSITGLYILCLNNIAVIQIGFLTSMLIFTYPLFKRFTYWPQLMLAITINSGVLMGSASVHESITSILSSSTLSLYMSSILWTMYYDTIYAHQDKTDDLFAGVKSTALKLGDKTKPFLYCMLTGMYSSLVTTGIVTSQTLPYYLALSLSSAIQMNQTYKLNIDDVSSCWNTFDRQKYIGLIILAGIIASNIEKYRKKVPIESDKEIGYVENM